MGGLISRSSSIRPEETKTRWRRGKRKRLQKMETLNEGDNFLNKNDNEQNNSNGNLVDTYDEWNKRIDQQQRSNIHGDPPGAPSTYSNNFPMHQNDLMNQSWLLSHDVNNHYYPDNSLSMTTKSNILYDSNQYNHNNIFINQSHFEERPSKKVQFASSTHQQESSKKPLNSTHSWHEPSITNNDVSTSTTRQEPGLSRQLAHRSVVMPKNTSLALVSVEKPIYVGIDHRATLAERGQTTANKHHHKNNSETLNNHRSRPHIHHQHKHQDSNDALTFKNNISSNRSFEPSQGKFFDTHRQLTTTSTSTVIPNKQIQHIEQSLFNDNAIKIPKTRNNRPPQSQHTEPQSFIDNDTKSLRTRGNHSEKRQQRTVVNRNNSPVRTETIRRVEIKQQGTPVMRMPTSQSQQQQRQKQSTMIPSSNITRTRI